MNIIKNQYKCCGCRACVNRCPTSCIQMITDQDGFDYPVVNETLCIECGMCQNVCPLNKDYKKEKSTIMNVYACYNNKLSERIKSSSGGIFSLLAKWILNKNGIVFGAAFNEKMLVEHIGIETYEDLSKLRGAKYVESDVKNIFQQVEHELKKNRDVLFSGTPCQVQGLLCFLNKDYEKLICVDIVCHGVPSSKVWAEHIKYKEKQVGSKLVSVSFRNKDIGWKRYLIRYEFDNGLVNSVISKEDTFMKGFLKDLYSRPSCYECKFKGIERPSDFTLGDFWGSEKVVPELDDDKGLSMLLINSKKGVNVFEEISPNIKFKTVESQDAVKNNPSIIRPILSTERREVFIKKYNEERNLEEAIKCAVGQDVGEGRIRQHFELYGRWIENLHGGIFLYDTLNKIGIKKVGIIGFGNLGSRVHEELTATESTVDVMFQIDDKAKIEQRDKECDGVIICSYVDFYEIKAAYLREGVPEQKILSLKQLIYYTNK